MTDREQFDAFYATLSPLETTEATAFACWLAARSADEALMRESLESLETATNGLAWYRDAMPEADSGADDEAAEQISSAIAALRARLEKEGTT